MENSKPSCGHKHGSLPSCAPLAVPYVPMQQSAEPRYPAGEALSRGTLFPGLDLPFMNMVNNQNAADTPLGELMALDFVLDELELYLDTHSDDKEAFQVYQQHLSLAEEGRKRYIEKYGPIQQTDMLGMGSYSWLSGQWPWEFPGKEGKR